MSAFLEASNKYPLKNWVATSIIFQLTSVLILEMFYLLIEVILKHQWKLSFFVMFLTHM